MVKIIKQYIPIIVCTAIGLLIGEKIGILLFNL